MKIQTQEQYRRTLQALTETDALIAKEMRYSPDLRKQDYLASLEKHQAKLIGMINEWRPS